MYLQHKNKLCVILIDMGLVKLLLNSFQSFVSVEKEIYMYYVACA